MHDISHKDKMKAVLYTLAFLGTISIVVYGFIECVGSAEAVTTTQGTNSDGGVYVVTPVLDKGTKKTLCTQSARGAEILFPSGAHVHLDPCSTSTLTDSDIASGTLYAGDGIGLEVTSTHTDTMVETASGTGSGTAAVTELGTSTSVGTAWTGGNAIMTRNATSSLTYTGTDTTTLSTTLTQTAVLTSSGTGTGTITGTATHSACGTGTGTSTGTGTGTSSANGTSTALATWIDVVTYTKSTTTTGTYTALVTGTASVTSTYSGTRSANTTATAYGNVTATWTALGTATTRDTVTSTSVASGPAITNIRPLGYVTYWFHREDDTLVGTYKQAREDLPEDTFGSDVITLNSSSGEVLFREFATPVGEPGNVIPAGDWTLHFYHTCNYGPRTIVLRVFRRTFSGTETELFNAETTIENSGSCSENWSAYEYLTYSANKIYMGTSERLVFKVYAKTTSVSDVTDAIYYDDSYLNTHLLTYDAGISCIETPMVRYFTPAGHAQFDHVPTGGGPLSTYGSWIFVQP